MWRVGDFKDIRNTQLCGRWPGSLTAFVKVMHLFIISLPSPMNSLAPLNPLMGFSSITASACWEISAAVSCHVAPSTLTTVSMETRTGHRREIHEGCTNKERESMAYLQFQRKQSMGGSIELWSGCCWVLEQKMCEWERIVSGACQ